MPEERLQMDSVWHSWLQEKKGWDQILTLPNLRCNLFLFISAGPVFFLLFCLCKKYSTAWSQAYLLYFEYMNVAVQVPQKSTGMTKSPVLLYNQENESVEKQKQKANPQVLMHGVFKKHSQPKQQNYHCKNVTSSPYVSFFSEWKGTKTYLF